MNRARRFLALPHSLLATLYVGCLLSLLYATIAFVASPPPRPVLAEPALRVVWANRRSGLYHLAGCRSYPKGIPLPHWVAFRAEDEAIQAGYRKAGNCPP